MGPILATRAVKSGTLEIGDREEATLVTHVCSERVRYFKQAFFEELRGAMCNHTIALHFSEAQATASRTT